VVELHGGVRGDTWYVKVEGLEEMIQDLDKFAREGGKLETGLDKMLRKVTGKCKNYTEAFCPKGKTKKLVNSIKMKKVGRLTYEIQVGYPTPTKGEAYYAPFVEWGTSKMAGRHFLLRAYMVTLPTFFEEIQRLVG